MTEYTPFSIIGRFSNEALTICLAPQDKSAEPIELIRVNPELLHRDTSFMPDLMQLLLTSMERSWGALRETPS